jgi:hypothetical protein
VAARRASVQFGCLSICHLNSGFIPFSDFLLLCFAFTCRSELARFVMVFGDAFAFGRIPHCVDGRIFGVKANL